MRFCSHNSVPNRGTKTNCEKFWNWENRHHTYPPEVNATAVAAAPGNNQTASQPWSLHNIMVGHHWTSSAPINNEYVIIANEDQSAKHVISRQILRWKCNIKQDRAHNSHRRVQRSSVAVENRIQLNFVECVHPVKNVRAPFSLSLSHSFVAFVSIRLDCSGNVYVHLKCEIGEFSVVILLDWRDWSYNRKQSWNVRKRMNWQQAHVYMCACTCACAVCTYQYALQ